MKNSYFAKRLAVSFIFGALILLGKNTSVLADSDRAAFRKYYDQVLVKKHGYFQEKQSGKKKKLTDEWMDVTGVLGSSIMDYDGDGKLEMLVLVSQEEGKCRHTPGPAILNVGEAKDYGKIAHVYLYMFERVNGKVKQSSKKLLDAKHTGVKMNDACSNFALSPLSWLDTSAIVSSVKVNGQILIVFERSEASRMDYNGSVRDHCIFEYQDNTLRFKASLTQTDGATDQFAFTAFSFEKGKRTDAYVSYVEEGWKPCRYNSYPDAVSAFYREYGLKVNRNKICDDNEMLFQSVLSGKNKLLYRTGLSVKCTKQDYTKHIYQYQAEIKNKDFSAKQSDMKTDSGSAKVSFVKIDKSRKFQKGKLVMYYQKPVLSGNGEAVKKINKAIEQDANELLKKTDFMYSFMDELDQNQEVNYGYEYRYHTKSEVKYNQKGMISFRMKNDWYIGGVYDQTVYGLNYNVKSGKKLKLTEVCNCGEKKLKEKVRKQLKNGNYKLTDSFWKEFEKDSYKISNMDFYIISDDKVAVCFAPYQFPTPQPNHGSVEVKINRK